MQNFSDVEQEKHFQIGGWMKGERKFNGKLTISRAQWEIWPRLLLIT